MLRDRQTDLPPGRWRAEGTCSSLAFAVRHMLVGTLRGELRDFDAVLVVDGDRIELHGAGRVASITTRDEAIATQLLAPPFFDEARHPDVSVVSETLSFDAGRVRGTAALTIRSVTRRIGLSGAVAGPVIDPFGCPRLGLDLEATIDRTLWGMVWNAPLPGGALVLANDVELSARLELVRERPA